MSALFALPTDLLHLVFREWLLVKDLVGFDSACSRSVRWSYLSLTRDPVFIIPKVSLPERLDVRKFVAWVNLRSVKLSELSMSSSCLKPCTRITYYSLETVHSLELTALEPTDVPYFFALVKLLPRLASLSLVEVDHFPNNAHFVFLVGISNLKLLHVKLDRSFGSSLEWANSCVHLHPFIIRFGADMVTMNLGVRAISEETLRFICTKCMHVKQLTFACDNLSCEAMLTYLASDNLPCLEVLDIFDYNSVLDDATLIAIAKCHPGLVSMEIIWESDVHVPSLTMASCLAILSHCPAMHSLNSYAYQYNQADQSMLIRTQLVTSMGTPINLVSFSRPLRDISHECADSFSPETMVSLVTLIEACGRSLTYLNIYLGVDVDDQMICQMMVFCGRLESLEISGGALTDACLIAIGENCTRLKSLGINPDVVGFTVAGWNNLFHAIGNELTTLIMFGQFISGEMLDAIAATCPALTNLRLLKADGMLVQNLTDHWVSPNKMPELKHIYTDSIAIWESWRIWRAAHMGFDPRWDEIIACPRWKATW